MSVTANLPDQLEALRRENRHLEADNLTIRGRLAAAIDDRERARRIAASLEQHIAEAVGRLQHAAADLEAHDFELSDAIAFLAGEVAGR